MRALSCSTISKADSTLLDLASLRDSVPAGDSTPMRSMPCVSVTKAEGFDEASFQSLVIAELKNLAEQQATLRGLAESHHRELLNHFQGQIHFQEKDRLLLPDESLVPIGLAEDVYTGSPPGACALTTGPDSPGKAMEVTGMPGVAEPTSPSKRSPKKSVQFLTTQSCIIAADAAKGEDEFTPKLHTSYRTRIREFFCGPYFDMIMGGIILLNMVLLFAELQIKGSTKIKYDLDLADDAGYWSQAEDIFVASEYGLTICYLAELTIRLLFVGYHHFADPINVLDALIVIVGAVQVFVIDPWMSDDGAGGPNISFGRIVKLFRMLRIVKMFKFMNNFSELRILLKTLAVSVWSLVWSMMLVNVIVLASGLLMFQLVVDVMEDESRDMDMRQWMYNNFGTAAKASYTMFECTFSGGWVPTARYMVQEVSAMFAFYWMFYIILVNFAVMKVVGALFLKQTMQVASRDAEHTMIEKMKNQENYARQLHEIFTKADSSGDGVISNAEFEDMMADPQILEMFEKMEVDLPEIRMLFGVLTEDDGETDYQEFLAGALKMKNSARCIDTIQIQHTLGTIKRNVHTNKCEQERTIAAICERMDRLDKTLSKVTTPAGSRWGQRQCLRSAPEGKASAPCMYST